MVTDRDGEDVMSFVFSELRRDRIFRADYIYVRPSRFVASKGAYCAQRKRALRYRLASYPFFGIAVSALFAALVQRVRTQRREAANQRCWMTRPSILGVFQGAAARAKGLQSARSQRRSPQAAQRGST